MSEVIDVKSMKPNQLASLYLDQLSADVMFACGPDGCQSPDLVPAHKIILSSCSAVFKTMFFGSLPEKPIIRITDASGNGFREFLQFFYMEKVETTIENASEGIYLSKKYEVNELLNVYSNLLQRKLTIDRVCQGLELAIRFDLPALKKFCDFEIIKNHVKFFASDGFVRCSPEVLQTILQLEELKLHSEEMFVGCFRWARNALKRKSGTENEPTLSDIRNQMGDYFDLIEFGSMKCQAITMILYEFNGFFTTKDLALIYMTLATKFPANLDGCAMHTCILFPNPISTANKKHFIGNDNITTFESSKKIFFVGYKHARILQDGWVTSNFWLTLSKKSSNPDKENGVVLLRQKLATAFLTANTLYDEEEKTIEPIMIQPDVKYEIRIKPVTSTVVTTIKAGKHYTERLFASNVCNFEKSVKVSVEGTNLIFSSLKFKF